MLRSKHEYKASPTRKSSEDQSIRKPLEQLMISPILKADKIWSHFGFVKMKDPETWIKNTTSSNEITRLAHSLSPHLCLGFQLLPEQPRNHSCPQLFWNGPYLEQCQ